MGDATAGFSFMSTVFNIQNGVPELFRVALLLLSAINLMASVGFEYILVDQIFSRWQMIKEAKQVLGRASDPRSLRSEPLNEEEEETLEIAIEMGNFK